MREKGRVGGQGQFGVGEGVEEEEKGCGGVGGAGLGGREVGGGGLEEGEAGECLVTDGQVGAGEWDEQRWNH